jgi:hypothetical protein
LPGEAPGVETAACEDNMASDGVGMGLDESGRLGSPVVGVDTHVSEVVSEPALHVLPHSIWKRPTTGEQNLVDNRRSNGRSLSRGEAKHLSRNWPIRSYVHDPSMTHEWCVIAVRIARANVSFPAGADGGRPRALASLLQRGGIRTFKPIFGYESLTAAPIINQALLESIVINIHMIADNDLGDCHQGHLPYLASA